MGLKQTDILVESLFDAGAQLAGNRVGHYRHVLDLNKRSCIRFAVKASWDAFLLFSEKHITSINYNTDFEYVEVNISGWNNDVTIMRVGTMGESGEKVVNSPDILNNTAYKYFWVAWQGGGGNITLGHGLVIGEDAIIERPYNATIDIKYMSLFNGFGSGGQWHVYAGTYYYELYFDRIGFGSHN